MREGNYTAARSRNPDFALSELVLQLFAPQRILYLDSALADVCEDPETPKHILRPDEVLRILPAAPGSACSCLPEDRGPTWDGLLSSPLPRLRPTRDAQAKGASLLEAGSRGKKNLSPPMCYPGVGASTSPPQS